MTISARKSWTLSPQDKLDAAYMPSLWRIHDIALHCRLSAVTGTLLLSALLHADPTSTVAWFTHGESDNRSIATHSGSDSTRMG